MGATATTATRSHKRCDVTEQRNRDQAESIGGRFGQDKAGSCCSRRRSIERIVATHNEADGLPRVRCRRGLATPRVRCRRGLATSKLSVDTFTSNHHGHNKHRRKQRHGGSGRWVSSTSNKQSLRKHHRRRQSKPRRKQKQNTSAKIAQKQNSTEICIKLN